MNEAAFQYFDDVQNVRVMGPGNFNVLAGGSSRAIKLTDYPFNEKFFFITNLAVGGNWPGNPDNTISLPQSLIVDYARVYQQFFFICVLT